jgi:cysteinyl-tRNA synthetase
VLKTHYRRQMEVGSKELSDAQKDVEGFDALVRRARSADLPEVPADPPAAFRDAMDDDFDTPAAIAVLQTLRRDANSALDEQRLDDAARLVATVRSLTGALGLVLADADDDVDGDVTALIRERDEARKNKDWEGSDRIRDQLLERGIQLEDTPNGTIWRKV